MINIGVLVSGRGSNLQALIDSCESGYVDGKVVVVISDKKDAFALERARNHGSSATFLDSNGKTREDFDDEIAKELDNHNVDLICLAGYMKLISKPFVKKFYGKIMNIHPALLPSFPGLHGQKDAIEWGAKISGCTVHFIDEEVDHGPIIMQAAVPVDEDDTEDTLAKKILEKEHKIYPKAVKMFAQGKLRIDGRRVIIGGDSGYLF